MKIKKKLKKGHLCPVCCQAGLLQTTVAADVSGLIVADGSVDLVAYKETIKIIHTIAVSNHLTFYPTNKILQLPAPDISASEADLTRHHPRSTEVWPVL